MTQTQTDTARIEEAAREYIARRQRAHHPDGGWHGPRWYPDDTERQDCCDSIREPSRAYPYSLMHHCRTAEHVAHLYNVDVSALRRAARQIDAPHRVPPKRPGGDRYYKAVAVLHDGTLVSIYDGQTEYVFGQTLRQTARQEHNGGYYVYNSIHDALRAELPSNSTLLCQRRAVIRVRCEGQCCRYDNGKYAFSRITPLEFVTYPYDPYGHPADRDNSCIDSHPYQCYACQGTGRRTHEYEEPCYYCNGHGSIRNY